jgi:DUF4097 and DUF4098 domain-containing protein YvlB
MNRTRLSPIDILGITLGVLAVLVMVGSIVAIVQGRMFWGGAEPDWNWKWDVNGWQGQWHGPAAAGSGALREEKDDQVPGAFTEIEVRTIAGSIEVAGGDAASGVLVHSVKTASFPGGLGNVRVDIQPQGNRLVVEEKHERGFMPSSGTVSFKITLPRSVKVVEARSVSGSLTVRPSEAGVDQRLSTVSGSITSSGARNLEASTTSGGIQFEAAGARAEARSVSGSIDGRLSALDKGGSVRLSTISGSVRLDAFAGLDASIDLHSVSGRVSCDFPVTISEQRNNRLRGKVGSGSASLEAGSTSGSISIHKL